MASRLGANVSPSRKPSYPVGQETASTINKPSVKHTSKPSTNPSSSVTAGDTSSIKVLSVNYCPTNAVTIVSQDTSTVTEEPNQMWKTPTQYFYEFEDNVFDTKCYKIDYLAQNQQQQQATDSAGVTVIGTVTIQCNTLESFATLRICLQDTSGELLGPHDNSTVSKCCHSIAPKETPLLILI